MLTAFEIAKQRAAELNAIMRDKSDALNLTIDRLSGGVKGAMGLTPDHVKQHPDFRSALNSYERAFQALRAFNAIYTRQFKTELAAERRAERA